MEHWLWQWLSPPRLVITTHTHTLPLSLTHTHLLTHSYAHVTYQDLYIFYLYLKLVIPVMAQEGPKANFLKIILSVRQDWVPNRFDHVRSRHLWVAPPRGHWRFTTTTTTILVSRLATSTKPLHMYTHTHTHTHTKPETSKTGKYRHTNYTR